MTVHMIKFVPVPVPLSGHEGAVWQFCDFTASRCKTLPVDAVISGVLRCRIDASGGAMVAEFTGADEAPEGAVGGAAAEDVLRSLRWDAGACQIEGLSVEREVNPGWPVVFAGYHGITYNIPDAPEWLKALCEATGARVVSTSYLRRYGMDDIIAAHPGVPFAGSTPWSDQGHKGAEIDAWLAEHRRRRYVVLDTSAEAAIGHETRFVWISNMGLEGAAVSAAVEILGRPL